MNDSIEEARRRHEAGDDLGAVAVLTQAIARDGGLKEAYLWRARVFQSMGCLKEAEEDIDRLLPEGEHSEAPDEVWMCKAALRLGRGDGEGAIAYYTRAKAQNPQLGNAYVGLSMAYSLARRLDLALATMDEALGRLPEFGNGYKERGRIKLLLHDQAGAADDLKKALEVSPEAARELEGRFTNLHVPGEAG